MKHKQLHDHLALTLLQYPCRMHHNTHQMTLDVGLHQHRCRSDELLQSEKGFFALRAPFEFDFLL
jgi:hypothetical protein